MGRLRETPKASSIRSATLYNAPTLARSDEFPMNPWLTSNNSVKAKFAEFLFHALR